MRRVVSHWCRGDVGVSGLSGEGIGRVQVGELTRRTSSFDRPTSQPLILPSPTRQHPTNIIQVVVLQRLQTTFRRHLRW